MAHSATGLRRAGSQLDKDWSDIEMFIKQRNNNLPRLIQTCKSYMPQGQESLRLVAEARGAQQQASSPAEKREAATKTAGALRALFADAVRFDGLKSNNSFIQLRSQLLEIEERIVERRDGFNEDVTSFNARLARFPGSFFARKGKLKARAPWIALLVAFGALALSGAAKPAAGRVLPFTAPSEAAQAPMRFSSTTCVSPPKATRQMRCSHSRKSTRIGRAAKSSPSGTPGIVTQKRSSPWPA